MLERKVYPNGVVVYLSPLLKEAKVRHAFSTRVGGVSTGAFASLNLGNPSASDSAPQDEGENIAENYRRMQEAISCPRGTMRAWVRQVHGRNVELIEREPENEYAETVEAEVRDRFSGQTAADGLVSVVPGVLISVRVADCVPVLLASEDGRAVSAVHAGWRGVVGNVVEKAVRTLHEVGFGPEKLMAAIGPGISAEHFEVGEEVAKEFESRGLSAAVWPAGKARPKPHVDLQKALRVQLEGAGITRIDGNQLCTYRDASEFYSHRRDKGITGRMAAVAMAREHG